MTHRSTFSRHRGRGGPCHPAHAPGRVLRTVRRLRRDLNLTQQDFATLVGVSVITVHRWETGQSRPRRLALARLREIETCNLGEHYWLYVVLDCATSAPQPTRVKDPLTKLVAKETTRMRISVGEVLGATEAGG